MTIKKLSKKWKTPGRHSTRKTRGPQLAGLFAALVVTAALAAPADLDPAFDGDGKVITAIGSGDDGGRSVVVLADGKILLGGYSFNSNSDFALARYHANGTLDSTFDGDGHLTTAIGSSHDGGEAVAVQADGKILLGGWSNNGGFPDFALARYHADGTLDTSFSGDGHLTTAFAGSYDQAFSAAVQADGKILLGGYSSSTTSNADDFALARYTEDGTLDTSFSGDGKVTTDFNGNHDFAPSMAVQADGKIVLGGQSSNGTEYDFAVARYNPDGTLDTSFSGDGKVTTAVGSSSDLGQSVAVLADGKILLGGYSFVGGNLDFAVVRYLADGTLDTSFSGDGKVTTAVGAAAEEAYSMAVQADGKILLSGFSHNGSNTDFALVRYLADGTLDTGFDDDGKLTTPVGSFNDVGESVAVQADGKILLGGQSYNGSNNDFALVRYLGDPTDTTPPVLASLGVGTSGASNGLPYLQVRATDAGSGVLKVQLTANSTNCHLEYPLGTRVVPDGTPRPHTLILPSAMSSITVFAVKDTNAKSRVEIRAWDAADNTTLMDPVIASLEIKKGRRLSRTFTGIPAFEHYITLQNGTPGLTDAKLWVNGRVVSQGSLADGQTITLNVAAQMRPGKRNTVRITASGAKGSKAMLLIGDQSLAGGSVAPVSGGRALNLEFAR